MLHDHNKSHAKRLQQPIARGNQASRSGPNAAPGTSRYYGGALAGRELNIGEPADGSEFIHISADAFDAHVETSDRQIEGFVMAVDSASG